MIDAGRGFGGELSQAQLQPERQIGGQRPGGVELGVDVGVGQVVEAAEGAKSARLRQAPSGIRPPDGLSDGGACGLHGRGRGPSNVVNAPGQTE
jgi:hypothetical protein